MDFLAEGDVLLLHKRTVDRYGGELGIRDHGLLISALSQPKATFGGHYLCATLQEMGGCYLYHLVANHPFLDGNKPIGTICGLTFLQINGIPLPKRTPSNDTLYRFVMEVAQGRCSKREVLDQFLSWFGKTPISRPIL
ncbi:MAG: type II toxin-antitoxin system death-on-curing family toxin [Parachlamydiales bacterium]